MGVQRSFQEEEMIELQLSSTGGRVILAEGTAGAKVLRQS